MSKPGHFHPALRGYQSATLWPIKRHSLVRPEEYRAGAYDDCPHMLAVVHSLPGYQPHAWWNTVRRREHYSPDRRWQHSLKTWARPTLTTETQALIAQREAIRARTVFLLVQRHMAEMTDRSDPEAVETAERTIECTYRKSRAAWHEAQRRMVHASAKNMVEARLSLRARQAQEVT